MFDIKEKFKEAAELHASGQLAAAKTKFIELVNHFEHIDIYCMIALISFDLRQYNEAIAYGEKGLKLEQKVDLYGIIANSYRALNNQEKANEYYIEFHKKIAEMEPNNAQNFYNLAQTLYTQKRIFEAAYYYKTASRLDPVYQRFHEPIGNILEPQVKAFY